MAPARSLNLPPLDDRDAAWAREADRLERAGEQMARIDQQDIREPIQDARDRWRFWIKQNRKWRGIERQRGRSDRQEMRDLAPEAMNERLDALRHARYCRRVLIDLLDDWHAQRKQIARAA